MYLTREEEAMLKGEEGEGVRRCMEILVKTGEFFGAKNMVPIVKSYVTSRMDCDIQYIKDLARLGIKFRVPTYFEYAYNDTKEDWMKFGVPPEKAQEQIDLNRLFIELIGDRLDSGIEARFGDHVSVSWTGACFVNAMYGARTNCDCVLMAIAAGVTGRTPNYGFHLKENRYGNVLVKVEADLKSLTDVSAVGYITAIRLKGDWRKVPVFVGMPYGDIVGPIGGIGLLGVSGGLQTGGGPMQMFHVPGQTPEAPTLEAAFGPMKAEETMTITTDDVKEYINSYTDYEGDIDVVCSVGGLSGLIRWAKALKGKKIAKGVHLWIDISFGNKALASSNTMGNLVNVIEDAGGAVGDTFGGFGLRVPETLTKDICEKLGYRRLVTDNLSACHYRPGNGWPYHGPGEAVYRPTNQCIEAALTGKVKAWKM